MAFLLGLWVGAALMAVALSIVAMRSDELICPHCGAPL